MALSHQLDQSNQIEHKSKWVSVNIFTIYYVQKFHEIYKDNRSTIKLCLDLYTVQYQQNYWFVGELYQQQAS